MLARRHVILMAQEIGLRRGGRDHRDVLLGDAVRLADQVGEGRRALEGVEAEEEVDPRIGGAERHLHLGDDAVGAIGMGDLGEVVAGQLQHARARLHGDDLEPDHIAGVAQAPPGDGADAARAAGDEAADRGRGIGGGVHADFLRLRPRHLVDVGDDGAGLGDEAAGLDGQHLVHAGEVEDDAARERHGLAVIAGAGAARRHGDAELMGGGQHPHHLLLAHRRDDDVAGDMVELALQRRRIPVEVAALLADEVGIVLRLDAGELRLEAVDVVARARGGGGGVGHGDQLQSLSRSR